MRCLNVNNLLDNICRALSVLLNAEVKYEEKRKDQKEQERST